MTSTVSETPMKTFADAEVKLAEALPGYESRPQQQLLAQTIEKAIVEGNHLLAEAGTGTGKSLGYLIPAILSGKRTIISTATKALQDQIFDKDLPFLDDHLGVRFSYALLKGRSNYFCLNKAQQVVPGECPNLGRMLAEAANPEFGGTKEDFSFEITPAEWAQVASESDDCQALLCSKQGICFADMARKKAQASQIVVVNHALFLTDLVVREATGGFGSMIGDYSVVVFDEAHEIEEYAGNAFGSTFKDIGIRNLVTEVRNFANRSAASAIEPVQTLGAAVQGAVTALWMKLEEGRIRQPDLMKNADEWVTLANALHELAQAVESEDILDRRDDDSIKRLNRIHAKVNSIQGRFARIITDPFTETVRWVETVQSKNGPVKVIRSAPINVGKYLTPMLFDTDVTAILASATLSVNEKFDYISGRLGIRDYDSVDVGTPFDYAKQAALYIPTDLPEPTPANKAVWSSLSTNRTLDLTRASDGRALLLYTSGAQMNASFDAIADRLPYNTMKQGEAPNKVLAETFKEDVHSVLFGLRSFMTGVDFQGETCSLVVLDKLPFPVPTEPITEARCEAIKARGGNDFSEYTIPYMTLVLKQAFGRAIRHTNDRAVVAILDKRLRTKPYGKKIVASLPGAQQLTDFKEVTEFYG